LTPDHRLHARFVDLVVVGHDHKTQEA
jgi:hypothetical protein